MEVCEVCSEPESDGAGNGPVDGAALGGEG